MQMRAVTPTTIPTIMPVLLSEEEERVPSGVVVVLLLLGVGVVLFVVSVVVLVLLLVLPPSVVLLVVSLVVDTGEVRTEPALKTAPKPPAAIYVLNDPELMMLLICWLSAVNAAVVADESADELEPSAATYGSMRDTMFTDPLYTPTTLTRDVSLIDSKAHILLINVVTPSFL